jgi:phosphoribosylformylglycinamidine synthase
VTNCLNFGNPETGEVGYELAEAIEGMALACEALSLPVVSGNVSLYNEHFGRPIYPTPVVGVVGVLDDAELAVPAGFQGEGDPVLVVGGGRRALDGSLYQKLVLGEVGGRIPEPDLENERLLHEFLAAAAGRRLLRSAHDVAGGGVAFAIAEAAVMGGVGVKASVTSWFAEGEGAAVITAGPADVGALRELAGRLAVIEAGTTGGDAIELAGDGSAMLPLDEAHELYEGAIPAAMGE